MMSNNILERRKEYVKAWNETLAGARTFPPHALHDRKYLAKSREEGCRESTPVGIADLRRELAAWEQASDDDFQKFEQSLE